MNSTSSAHQLQGSPCESPHPHSRPSCVVSISPATHQPQLPCHQRGSTPGSPDFCRLRTLIGVHASVLQLRLSFPAATRLRHLRTKAQAVWHRHFRGLDTRPSPGVVPACASSGRRRCFVWRLDPSQAALLPDHPIHSSECSVKLAAFRCIGCRYRVCCMGAVWFVPC